MPTCRKMCLRHALALFGLWGMLIAASHAASGLDDKARRFSVAISGGGSLGAYEAGLNWGVLRAIRAFEQNSVNLGGTLRPIEAASFAGASAGGINAVVSAMVWCVRSESEGGFANRIDDNVFRNLWMLPDVNNLLPPNPESPLYAEGDALFTRSSLRESGRNLISLWGLPAYRQGCRVPIGLTVTRVVPELLDVNDVEIQNQRFYLSFDLRTQADGRAGFFFNPADFPTLTDPAMILLPRERGAPMFSIAPERIIDSMFTSASVPLAFGRRRVAYCRLKPGALIGDRSDSAPAQPVVEAALSCPSGYEIAEADFADGGLFDNLPIGVARVLAEQDRRAADNPLPVMYVYLEPDRTRYSVPKGTGGSACEQPNPPRACRKLDFGLSSEGQLLSGALSTARKYELYRELTSEHWGIGVPDLAYAVAHRLEESGKRPNCRDLLAVFEGTAGCAERVRQTARLLELSYGRQAVPIGSPFSAPRLEAAGLAHACRASGRAGVGLSSTVCGIDTVRLRDALADALVAAMRRAGLANDPLVQRVQRGRLVVKNDRSLRVSSRGAPVTGSLLSSLGAFLDRKFREYDYYVGVYDALVSVGDTICRLSFSLDRRSAEYPDCVDETARFLYGELGVAHDPRGRYVLALLARAEFGSQRRMRFAYDPMPEEDRDMRIIHEGMRKTLEAGYFAPSASQELFFVEESFFRHLRSEGFEPSPTPDGRAPLLAQIMADPDAWSAEAVRRITSRLVYLEQQARDIYAEREPNEEKREQAMVGLLGATSHVLRSATYKYPSFSFAPSTAPDDWFWRNLVPFEVGFDLVDGDFMLTWQPTWALGANTALGIRGTIGVAGGLISPSASDPRENYLLLGLDFTRATGNQLWSSWGAMAGWYHTFHSPEMGRQDAPAADFHLGFFKDRIRLGLGARDINDANNSWFLTVGVADLPGLIYWLTR